MLGGSTATTQVHKSTAECCDDRRRSPASPSGGAAASPQRNEAFLPVLAVALVKFFGRLGWLLRVLGGPRKPLSAVGGRLSCPPAQR